MRRTRWAPAAGERRLGACARQLHDGTLSEMTWRGRVDVSPTAGRRAHGVVQPISGPFGQGESRIGSRLTYTMSPRMFAAALVQYQSRTQSMTTNGQIARGVFTGRRAVHRLQRRSG
ncbi:MAG: hypothetical protein IPP90_15885 [Gemmatimonadaceae bacterium]|nr:hypothetical protein [Gemmatimonadaceae bacterium]